MNKVECDDSGEVQGFVGWKIECNRDYRKMRITQPVLLQRFRDEFSLTGDDKPRTPGVSHKTLQLGSDPQVEGERRTYYRSGVWKLMHLRRWSLS
jgi:hypothetical protein